MPEKLISELLDLPETVRKGDFVLNLSKGVTEPDKTLEQYVVTPQLVACFDDALSFIRQAVEAVNSKACYLHGSFGSGKSHFMAVLHLLLQHNPAVRSIPELARLFDTNKEGNHSWVESKKFLLVPYHMIGARNMESAILGGYVDHVREVHPTAPLPGVYLADEIFSNAQQHRKALGDDKFFEQLNQGQKGSGSSGWGKLARGWDAARFAAALEAPPMSEERSRLVGDLVQYIFPAFKGIAQGKDEAYVDLDVGLSIISTHARTLGYDGLILFLDELILWLATHSADLGFVQKEGNKLAKLVESRKSERPVPIISFVARQRDLRDLIGDNVTGVEQLNFSDVLCHWEGRFHTITLEDRNLPVIAQKRVLRPKDGACRAELEESFEKTAQVRAEIMEVLLTREADRTMFKMVYPFSPALIQALVAVSSALQRERTALKIMLQLLVKRRDTLRLGDVIPLGDLWDVVAHGDEAFTDVMRVNFENAKKLYQNKLLPLLEEQHEIDLEVDQARASTNPEVAERLQRFENDDRLVKSLLLCALVHGVEALKNMNCLRLAALNHGTIRSRIPGREHQVVADKLRRWAGIVGEIRVGDESTNPTVSLQLSGVDTDTIIESAKTYDNIGTRQFKIRQMLFQSLGIPEQDDMFMSHSHEWRGSRRSCDLLFTNVRTLPDESLRATEDWKLIIDFPFDTEGHSPVEDLDRLDKFREKNERQRTLVWLPSFFSTRTQVELGKLVVIDRLLLSNNLEQHTKHLSMQDRETALAAKVKESITEYKADCDSLPDRLQLILKNLGVSEADSGKCERVRTARAVKAMLAACDNKEPTALVGAIAHAKLETNSTAMGRSLKTAKSLLECLRATKWELFSAVAQLQDQRRTEADLLIRDVCSWLKADEYALAGGLASKLSEAEGRAIRLLTPPKVVDSNPQLPPIEPPNPKPGWKAVGSGGKARMSNSESISEAKVILQKLEDNSKLRLTVQWTLEEEAT